MEPMPHTLHRRTLKSLALTATLAAALGGCDSLPPAANAPRATSVALADPTSTTWGKQFARAAHEHAGQSGFRIFSNGVDGFLMRMEMIATAERSLDLQYYIFRGDETGRLVTDALVRAADRGVAVRVLVDDGDTLRGDEQLFAIAAHHNIEIRVFNPLRYRGHNRVLRAREYLFNHARLDYRMHNKLLIADNAIALAGGRNIGDQYFQIDPDSQFADDDVFSGGPLVQRLSDTFDTFWNSPLAIPVTALGPLPAAPSPEKPPADKLHHASFDYQSKLNANEPLTDVISGALPLVWAEARVVFDSPDKRQVLSDSGAGSFK